MSWILPECVLPSLRGVVRTVGMPEPQKLATAKRRRYYYRNLESQRKSRREYMRRPEVKAKRSAYESAYRKAHLAKYAALRRSYYWSNLDAERAGSRERMRKLRAKRGN